MIRRAVMVAWVGALLLLGGGPALAGVTEDAAGADDDAERFEVSDEAWDEAIAAAMTIRARDVVAEVVPRPEPLRGIDDPQARQAVYARSITLIETLASVPNPDRRALQNAQRREAVQVLRYGGPETLALCLEAAGHENAAVRRFAVHRLGREGRLGLDVLHDAMLNDPDPDVRETALSSLRSISAPESIPFLIKALRDESTLARSRAARLLGDLHARAALEPLADALALDLRHTWCPVIDAMCKIDLDEARRLVTQVALEIDPTDPDNKGRANAILNRVPTMPRPYPQPSTALPIEHEAICRLAREAMTLAGEAYGDKEIDALIGHLDSPSHRVASLCVRALVHLRARAAVPALTAQLRDGLASEASNAPYWNYTALASLGGEDAWATLADAYRDPRGSVKRRQFRKLFITQALGDQGPAAVPLLMLMLEDPEMFPQAVPADAPGIQGMPRLRPCHRVLSALGSALGTLQIHNIAGGGRDAFPTLEEEVEAMRQWWAQNAEAYIAGEPTADPPRVMSYFYMS